MKRCVIKKCRLTSDCAEKPDGALRGRPADCTIAMFLSDDNEWDEVWIHFDDVVVNDVEVTTKLMERLARLDVEPRWFSTARTGLPKRKEMHGKIVKVESWDFLLASAGSSGREDGGAY